ncbi:MAG TPA: copper ion binding protein [Microthrixaceae bacterium]|nr:copper ion binding protein [Microthrixaceae bacterium]
MESANYKVEGMTCGHCVQSVTKEVGSVPGVDSVHVDLESGSVEVRSKATIDIELIRDAIDEAGFDLVS